MCVNIIKLFIRTNVYIYIVYCTRIVYLFINCKSDIVIQLFPNKDELMRNMMGLLGNVAEVEYLRPRLMTTVYINVFSSLVDSQSDGIEVRWCFIPASTFSVAIEEKNIPLEPTVLKLTAFGHTIQCVCVYELSICYNLYPQLVLQNLLAFSTFTIYLLLLANPFGNLYINVWMTLFCSTCTYWEGKCI